MTDQPGPSDDPFANLPMFGEIARALAGQGPLNWEAARQFAHLAATGGASEPNVEPATRLRYEELAGIVTMHLLDVTGVDLVFPAPRLVTRAQWAADTLEAYRHLFTELATSLGAAGSSMQPDETEPGDPMMAMMAGLSKLMAPSMLGMAIGSMIGRRATRAFGVYDLPIPRDPITMALIATTIDGFADEWSVPVDEMRLWVLAHEHTGHLMFSVPHIRDHLSALVRRHVGAFRTDPDAVADKLASLDLGAGEPMAALQQAFGDPEVVLGAIRSPEQLAMQPALDAAVAVVVGYLDWVVDAVAARLIGGDALRIAEAVRRRRVQPASDDVFVERLLGIRLGDEQVRRGKGFVQGVVDRAGEAGLAPLLERPDAMPTPAEVDAPGLWLARLDAPA
jgi:putative hydrolase